MALLKGFFRNIVSEFTGQLVVSRARVLIVLSDGLASGDGELPGETIMHFGADVPPLGRKIHVDSIIRAGSWHFVEVSFGTSADFTEVTHTTVLVLGEEIVALLVYAEGNWVGTGTRHLHPLLIFLVWLAGETVGRFGEGSSNLIRSRPWIFVDLDGSKRSSSLHFLSALPEAKA